VKPSKNPEGQVVSTVSDWGGEDRPTVADPKKGTIPMIPEYGGEDAPEREIKERDREDREVEYLNPDDNEAHAAGQICERCGAVITAGQDVRLRGDGRWVHEVCP